MTAFLVLVLAACGDSEGSTAGSGTEQADEGELVHVHDVLVGAGGSPVYLAAHTGLYELRDGEVVARSDHFDDLMAAAIEPDGTLIASGHPDLSTENLRIAGKPPLLGLVESDDGSTWTPRSLLGDADFHALVVTEGRLYGADSTSARVMVSDDGGHTWEPSAGDAQLLDLAINPADPDQMVGVDLDRGLAVSDDGGDSWAPMAGAPNLVDLEWTSSALVAIDAEGAILRSTDAGLTWTPAATLPGAEALGSDGTDVYAYAAPTALHRSGDDGESWSEVTP
ncbi:beta propeller repeat protein [Actinomarinicola tropica]|uniref:Exo-alpha-sialidase n=1 Tax=Actinomarinicola tropica TaxID=2789776 RepID=A0A5Q2RBC6_9ACTN|nr:hypothetical protein [Actinomarinicola tropica]QGG94169.1 hypothetical protein GH723_03110 [Actinomarinicola tropica]